MSFRGTKIQVTGAAVAGSTLEINLKFIDEAGTVHGIARHAIPLSAGNELGDAAQQFINAIEAWAYETHYTSGPDGRANAPHARTDTHVPPGIAEALQGFDPLEGLAEQG